MNYDLDIDNFTRIINSDTVPDDNNGLDLELANTEISIKKPYIDTDGQNMGNSIYIIHDNGLSIYIRIEGRFLFTFYRENESESFKSMEATSPEPIRQFAWQTWTAIVDYIEKAEEKGGQFGIYGVPYDLEKLLEFESEYGKGTFADGFYMMEVDKTGLKTYSEEESFLRSFIEFAAATAGGSTYAIWVINENLEKCPVVIFGDEGGIHVVAENTEDLIRLLGYDVEIMVSWDSAYFYKDKSHEEESEYHHAFLHWAKETLELDPVTTNDEADLIMKAANDKYADSLYDFLIKYDIDVDEGFEKVKGYRSLDAFENNFQGREIPGELALLFDFQQDHPNYAQYFLLRGYDLSVLSSWSQNEAFQKAIIPFARATSFGAFYALWDDGSGYETKNMPVIVLDTENGIDAVAENVLQLMRLLTYDIEPILDGECVKLSNDRDSYALSNNIEAYIEWLKDNFGFEPVEEPFEEIIDPAQDKFADAFWNWQRNY